MFFASKLLSFATQPLAWVALLLLTGLVCTAVRNKWGWLPNGAALLVLLIQGWEPLPDALLRHLESQYEGTTQTANLHHYAGVVVLGGALDPAYAWQGHGPRQVALTDAAERMTVPVALSQQNPSLRILFTGGEGDLFVKGFTEADRAKIFFDNMGIPPDRVIYESASHTTYENAIFSAQLPGVSAAQPWLLLTSAFHMPRSVALFRKAGWNVTPYPVDFRAGTQTPWTQYSLERGARKWHLALHEIVGLLAYRLAGRA